MKSVIDVQHCSKHYRNIKALEDISFEVRSGEIFGLVGPNGAGKTTLVRILTTLLKPTQGKILVLGKDVHTQHQQIRSEIGYVPSNPVVYRHLSAKENLIHFSSLHGIPAKIAYSRIELLLKSFDLWKWKDEKVKHFSTGMAQKVNIIRGILHQPKLLILDEPTAGLDPHSRRVVRDFVLETHRLGTTVILTTHVMWEVEEICHRIGIMHKGKFVGINTMGQFYNDYFNQRAYYEIRLRTELSPGFRENAEKMPFVLGINKVKDDYVLRIVHDARPEDFFELLRQSGKPIHEIEWMKPSLEEIFIQLTSQS